jgi:hypothetical protein
MGARKISFSDDFYWQQSNGLTDYAHNQLTHSANIITPNTANTALIGHSVTATFLALLD